MSIVAELKRRNVIRVALLYLAASWLVLQVTDVGVSLLGLTTSTGRLIFLLLALGFPFVLVFSWVYEITPDGIRKEREVVRSESITHLTAKKLDIAVIVVLLLAISVLVVDRLIPETQVVADVSVAGQTETTVTPEAMSIAVLPFIDLSATRDQQYFTDGLSEELLDLLVRVDGLSVASRTSSFAFRDRAMGVPAIARQLNVGHILEGSMRKDGDRIRITAQLVEAATDRHLWSQSYDQDFDDIFAIQDEIANAIVQALMGELGMDHAITVEAPTDNLDAYEIYLNARELFIRRERLSESIRLYRQAIDLDSEFARAWEGLAAAERVADDWLIGVRDDGIDHVPLAEEAANMALSLDPDLSMPYAVLGSIASADRSDMIAALEYFETAIEKDAQNSTAWLWKGTALKYAGYLDEAISDFERCLAIDPARVICRDYLAEAYLFKGEVDKALTLHAEVLERNFQATAPSFVSIHVRNGDRDLALEIANYKMGSADAPVIEWIRAIENPQADNSAGLTRLKDWARQMGGAVELPPQMLFSFRAYDEMLEIGEMQRRMLFHPDAEEFRRTPQFKQIARDRGFLALWQARGFPPDCRAIGEDDFECGLVGDHDA